MKENWLHEAAAHARKFRLIVGFGATAGCGKDHAARAIIQVHRGVKRIAFANALKARLRTVVPDDVNLFTMPRTEKEKWRPLMVAYGAAMRAYDADFWIKEAFRRFPHLDSGALLIVTDVRYANEVRALHAIGGAYIHIHRAFALPANDEERTHAPQALELADHQICNDGTPEFDAQVRRLVERLLREARRS